MSRTIPFALVALLVAPGGTSASTGRERALEQIPELMGRILDTQEEIRERDREVASRLEVYQGRLDAARRAIEAASSEDAAAEALVDYIEAYAARLDEQHAGLLGIESAVVRMRADTRELSRLAERTQLERGSPEERRAFFQDHYQGIAQATGELAERLGRAAEASTAGSVLHASWGAQGGLAIPLPELGREGAVAFARRVEGLHARVQARSNQLRAERRSVRRLLDVLIERQLASRLDSLFDGNEAMSLGTLLSGGSGSADWEDLGGLVRRTLGLPKGDAAFARRESISLERLDHFAAGGHREGGGSR